MHIIQITDDFLPFIGGMATHAWELSKALANRGHYVSVLTGANVRHSRPRFALSKRESFEGMQVINFGFSLFLRRFYSYYFHRKIKKLLPIISERSKYVILHIHEHLRQSDIRRLTDLPLVWTNHSSMFLEDFKIDRKKKVLAQMVNSCDWITTPSRELLNKTIELGYPANRTTYIPNGVDIKRFNGKSDDQHRSLSLNEKSIIFPHNACVVLCARRFVYKNGIHIYLDALESITPDVLSQCVFIFAGNKFVPEDDYECEISERIDVLSRKAVLHMLGPVPNDLMPEVYKVADISVLPSLLEATSITGLESMATGLPIVGTNAGGIPEIVEDGYNGLIGPAGDFSSLAVNLVRLIGDPNLRREMGAAGRQCAEKHFSWPRIADQFLDVYRNALTEQRYRLNSIK